jgi:hypothetical protein
MRIAALLLLFAITELKASSPCENIGQCTASCSGNILDLSLILRDILPLKIAYIAKNQRKERYFLIDPCQGLTCGAAGSPISSVCRQSFNGTYVSCGLLGSAEWYIETINPYRFVITFTEGSIISTIKFIENSTYEFISLAYIPQNSSISDYFVFEVTGKCIKPSACLNYEEKPIGIIGFVTMALFAAGILFYLCFGSIIMCIRGAKGIEIIPNIKFWKDLPHLVTVCDILI